MRPLRPPAGWTSVVLVTLMLLTVAWALEAETLNVRGLDILTYVVIGGVITGVVLGSQDWLPASLAHGWSIVVSIFGATFLATFVLDQYQVPATLVDLTILDKMALVRTWFFGWLSAVMGGGYPDRRIASFVFVFSMALLLWLISYVCVWFVVRYVSWWGAVLPSGFALLTALYSGPQKHIIYLIFFLFCAFLLAGKTHLALQEDRWRRERIGFNPDLRFDVLRDGLFVAVLVIAFGWLAPINIGSETLRQAMSHMSGASTKLNAQFLRWFPDVRVPARGGGNSFSNQLPLGGSISLDRQPVFDVHVDGQLVPRYFRMAVFDRYDGSGWQRQTSGVKQGGANALDLAADFPLTIEMTQTIRTLVPDVQQLYAAPQPERFSVPISAAVADGPTGGDVMAVESTSPLALGSGPSYSVVSRVSDADLTSLRADTMADPDWVTQRYLALPSSVPDRVLAKSREVSAGATNRYDQADTIEKYLRRFKYSEQIDSPPSDRDKVDWFIFDEMRGYCDYYASAFVVMARAIGIPARFAAGYSVHGEPGPNGFYRLLNSDAHTWPEVYFPGYGWIEFEPTAGDSEIQRPERMAGAAGQPTPGLSAATPTPSGTQSPDDLMPKPKNRPNGGGSGSTPSGPDLGALLRALALALVVGGGIAAALAVAWQRPLRGLTIGERAFAQFVRLASLMGLRPDRVETPFEYGRRVAGAIPDASGEIDTITDAFVRERFARRPADEEASHLGVAWVALRGKLMRAGAHLRLGRFRRRD